MSPVSGKSENRLKHALEARGLDNKYSAVKLIMDTSLYSVYLLSENEKPKAEDKILLIEHLPAQESSAHLLPVRFKKTSSKKETMQEIVAAVNAHFAQNEHYLS
ncbi:hypothetical protein [Planococcus halotolerans]|nr:hypothetical protein [Planococcus halotolerans]QHJ70086.1 hypothetical protein DNR44_005505 [Planococcus halotolerans]